MQDPELDAWIDVMAPMTGLTVTAEQRPGVRAFLGVAKIMAGRLEAVRLSDDRMMPAAVFTPEPWDATEDTVSSEGRTRIDDR